MPTLHLDSQPVATDPDLAALRKHAAALKQHNHLLLDLQEPSSQNPSDAQADDTPDRFIQAFATGPGYRVERIDGDSRFWTLVPDTDAVAQLFDAFANQDAAGLDRAKWKVLPKPTVGGFNPSTFVLIAIMILALLVVLVTKLFFSH